MDNTGAEPAQAGDEPGNSNSSGFMGGIGEAGWQSLLFLGAVVAGIASLLQTTFNTGLANILEENALNHPKSDLVAANVSFTFSTALLCSIVAMSYMVSAFRASDSETSQPEKERDDSSALVYFSYSAAGLLGATHIVLKVITSPILGLGLDYLFVVLGQLLASLLIDWFGFLGVEQTSPTWTRFGAIVLAVIGAVLVTLGADFITTHSAFLVVGAAALATIAGALHPVQAATMQVLRARHPNPWIVALISFGGGLLWLTAVCAVSLALDRQDGELGDGWLAAVAGDVSVFDVLGGFCGAAFIALTIMITPLLGMNSFYIVSVFGQLLAAVLVDAAPAASWKHALPTIGVSALRVVGVSMSVLGVVLLALPDPMGWFDRQKYTRVE